MLGRNLHQFRRYRHIVAVLGKYGFQEASDIARKRFPISLLNLFSRKQKRKPVQKHSRPVRVRLALEEMGPMFIKLGQLLSTRPDLVPKEYTAELEQLQDRVPPLPSQEVIDELERHLDNSVDSLFADFDREPLAAGSIAQVHRGRLHSGEEVAIKIRRPLILETIRAEIGILHDLTSLLRIVLFENDDIDVRQMVEEFSNAILQEADLNHERQNMTRFHLNHEHDQAVHIPAVYRQYCTDGVLVMEYINGTRPGKAEEVRQAGLDPLAISKNGTEFVLSQIFEHGLFHTDPHPGNLLILENNILAPLDFGQVARLGRGDLQLMNEMMVAIVENDPDIMLRALDRHNMIGENTNEAQLRSQTEAMMANYYGLPLAEIPFSELFGEIFDVIRHNHIRPPRQFTLMLKAMLTTENLATNLNPDYNIIQHLQPYAQRYRLSGMDPRNVARNVRNAVRGASDLAARLPDDMYSIMSKVRTGKFQMRIHHEHLNELSDTVNKSSSRISFALIIAALLVSSSMLVPQEGTILKLVSYQQLGMAGYIGAAILGIGMVISIIRSRHV